MKTGVLLIAAVIGLSACQSSDAKKANEPNKSKADTANYTTIKWIDSVKNIGVVAPGKKTEIKFSFVNSGSRPLLIISAKPGCGCTVADYPEEAIAPGAKGTITAAYEVPEKGTAEFRKNIVVTTNTRGSTVHNIFFYGKIKEGNDSTKNTSAEKAKNT